MDDTSPESSPESGPRPRRLWRFGLPALVLLLAATIAWWLLQSGPKATPRPKVRSAALVEVTPITLGPHSARIRVMGTVQPSRQVEIKPQVSGKVLSLHPDLLPGSLLTKGASLLIIEADDYRLVVRQLESELARVDAEIALEQGNQRVSRKEYELLGEQVSAEELALMLRQPQLASLRAARESVLARLEQARLDLQRTTVPVPFNALVRSREVNIGALVNSNTTLARLVGTDSYWVEAVVPVSQLRWIDLPVTGRPGSPARIVNPSAWGEGRFREGRVISLGAGLEEQGRMARLLIEVVDPLALQAVDADLPAMLLDTYVQVEIAGRELPAAAAVDRQLVRDGALWIMNEEDRLEIRPVEVTFAGRDQVLVTDGIRAGERLVLTDLPAPVAGMPLRLNTSSGADAAATGAGQVRP
ncbi:MAG: efflux RND transporter periplasmic adaptor subunit [Desulfuromonadales bacterium]|nr:efflux RND transporter periplasmic adaptor subunit [Desulfuromonadales bacterium]